ncbi:MAG: Bacterioopsin transcriptional activator [Methanoregula sp. PtaU1.Bin051]|nr:MAG: Bacterioopsin transcriptional activator [Methanoregula sp. PtaU1.Bin051]
MISVLYVDDEPGLLQVGKLFLEKYGGFRVETVTSAPEALKAIESGQYDAIISDYMMPDMDGIDFLKSVRASGNNIPFIIFTGRGREEIVIQALNEGADFYLQKGGEPKAQFTELAHKVQKAVLQRRAEARIRDYERRETDIINFLPDATFAIDTKGVVIAWNKAMEKMTGVASDQILGKGDYEYAIPFYHKRRPVLIDFVLRDDPGIIAKYPFINREGERLFSEITIPHFNNGRGAVLWFTASPLFDTRGNVVGAIESIRDITERKKAEGALFESERKFRELTDLLPQGIFEADAGGVLTYANRIAFTMFGYSREDFAKGLAILDMVAPEDRERAKKAVSDVLKGTCQAELTREYTALRKDGSTFPVSIYMSPVVVNGRIAGLRGIIIDITENRRAEREIRESEQKYRTVFETTGTAMILIENDGTISLANSEFARQSGYSKEEVEGKRKWMEFVVPEDLDRMLAQHRLRRADPEHALKQYEFRFRGRSGGIRYILLSIDLIPGTTKSIASLLDITERKRQERVLKTQLELGLALQEIRDLNEALAACLSAAIETSGMDAGGIYLVDEQTGSVDLAVARNLSDEFVQSVSHYPAGSPNAEMVMAGKPIYIEFHKIGISHTPVQEREGIKAIAIIPITYGGRVIACMNVASHVFDDVPASARIPLETIATQIGAAIERIRSEQSLAESEQQYRNVVEDQTEFISRFLPDGTHVFVNEAYCRYFGMERDKILNHRFRPEIPAEDRERVKKFFESLTPDHPVDIIEHCIRMPDGTIRWQRWSDRAIFDAAGSVIEYQSVGRDVTERKAAEKALSESEQRNAAILAAMPDLIFILSRDGTYLDFQVQDKNLLAVPPDQIIGKNILSAGFDAETVKTILQAIAAAIDTGTLQQVEYELKVPRGIRRFEARLVRLDATRVIGIVRDITRMKAAEEALKASEQKYRDLINLAQEGIWVVDTEGVTTFVNQNMAGMLGYTTEEMIGSHMFRFMDGAGREIARRNFPKYEKGLQERVEFEFIRKDGTPIYTSVSNSSIFDQSGRYTGTLAVISDITERKRAEKDLRESRERFRRIFEDSPLGIAIVSPDFRFQMVNRQFCGMLKYSEDELLARSFTDITHPDHLTTDLVESRKIYTGEREVYKTEKRYVKKDGSILWASLTASPVKDDTGTVLYTIALIEDITERKHAEEKLIAASQEYQDLLDNIQDVYYRSDNEGRLVRISRSMSVLLGYGDASEIIGRNIADEFYVNPADRKTFLEDLIRTGKVTNYKVQLKKKDGTPVWVSVNSHLWYNPDGSAGGVEGSFRDVTDLIRAEDAIREANKKINLLTSITRHDVANQVSILQGYTEIALMKKPEPAIADLLAKIRAAGSAISHQIEFTKTYQELGMHAPDWYRVSGLIARQRPAGVTVSCTCDAEIFADPMLEKVFFNLIDNAVRHGERVTAISVSCAQGEEGLVITVEDNGVGIPLDRKDKIFGKGYGKNTGFGLFLAREILAITGISIHETGVFGKGARFELHVPKEAFRFR